MKKALMRDVSRYWYFVGVDKIYDKPSEITGDLSGITGDLSGIRGNLSGITGDLSGIRGDLSGIRGDLSGIRGDLSGIRGDLSECEISDDERAKGIYIDELLKGSLDD